MKLTFTDLQDIALDTIGLTDAITRLKIKRDINIGAAKLLAALGREWNRKARFTDLVEDQQYYQMPEDSQKLKEVIVHVGGIHPPLEQIPDEFSWRRFNMTTTTGIPTHFFMKGNDEIGLYPIPNADTDAGLELVFSPKHVQLTQDDYTDGTVSVTEGSATVIGSGTTFTSKMAGQWLQITDGTDGNWYRIEEMVSTTELTLDNFYQGTTGSTKAYRIGQVVDYPDEFAEAPSDYACSRYYTRHKDKETAGDFLSLFQQAIEEAREQYGQTTDQQVVWAEPQLDSYNPFRGDPPPGGISA